MNKIAKIQFKMERLMYSAGEGGKLAIGCYSIIACSLVENLTEGVNIVLHPRYNTFALKSYTPIIFNKYDVYTIEVEEDFDEKYGMGYKLKTLNRGTYTSTEGEKRAFLESILAENMFNELYATYDNPYDLIENKDREKLLKVKGIGKKTVEKLIAKYESNKKYERLYTELHEYRLTKAMMESLIDRYKDAEVIIIKIKQNIYVLADEVRGIGFLRCDELARQNGVSRNSPYRLQAFIKYYLTMEAQKGNSWVYSKKLFGQINGQLGAFFSDDDIKLSIYKLFDDKILLWNADKTKITLCEYYSLEQDIYNNIKRLRDCSTENQKYQRNFKTEQKIIKQIENEVGYEFTDEQIKAVDSILNNQFSLLVGGAGVGKSTLIKIIASLYKKQHLSIGLATLSGKAGARIQEATGFEGSTIHRMLGYIPREGFTFNKENHLPYNLIIIDETSFIGGELFLSLLEAIAEGTRIVLVGDEKQLPAIGACNIFFDIINSNMVTLNRLTKIHRQAQKSGIIMASKYVREGSQLCSKGWNGTEIRGELQDFTIDFYDEMLISRPKLMDYYKRYVKTLEDTDKTQIILATKSKGDICTFSINNEIQEYLNPKSPLKSEILMKRENQPFILREGDKVINRKNDYKATIWDDDEKVAQIFNGFCGTIIKIQSNCVYVQFDMVEPIIEFSYNKLVNLELAYALTVHLYQGSQVENVIFLIDNSSFIMNTRELVYTAITRASKNCILLAQECALRHAINNSQTIKKQTFLKQMLIQNKEIKNA